MTTSDLQAHIAVLMPNLCGGGAGRVAVNLANSFAQRGHAVAMVLLSATGDFLADLRPEIRVVNLQVKRVRWALLPLVRYFRQTRPTVMLACMWPLTVAALWARALARVPLRLVVAEYTTWSRSELLKPWSVAWQVRTTMRHVLPAADGIVAVAQGAADDLARFANLDRNAITVIYNPVVVEAKPPANAPLSPVGCGRDRTAGCWFRARSRQSRISPRSSAPLPCFASGLMPGC